MHMNTFWKQGRALLVENLGVVNAQGPLGKETWRSLHQLWVKVSERQQAIRRAQRLTGTDILVKIAESIIATYAITWLLSPIPFGPLVEIHLSDGREIVGYHLKSNFDEDLLVAQDKNRVMIMPAGVRIKAEQICTKSQGFWSDPLLPWLGRLLDSKDDGVDLLPNAKCDASSRHASAEHASGSHGIMRRGR